MNIIRTEQDGIEFFTVEETGESGMSQSGLAVLSGVTRQSLIKLEETLVTKSPSKSLERFVNNVPTLVTNGKIEGKNIGNIKIYRHDFCGAVIRHYAYQGIEVAQYSLEKFSDVGMLTWIQQINGWQQERSPRESILDVDHRKSTKLRFPTTTREVFRNFFAIIDALADLRATAATYRIFFYLIKSRVRGELPNAETVAVATGVSRKTFNRTYRALELIDMAPPWLQIEVHESVEKIVRDRLHQELGGTTEAKTEFGLIDLLTDTEAIEVKEIQEWKTALGHVIAKGRFYPQHRKRLHLFGVSTQNLDAIRAFCTEMDVVVTFETLELTRFN